MERRSPIRPGATRKSPFFDQLTQRDANLQTEIAKLQIELKKITNELGKYELDKQKIDEKEIQLYDMEKEINSTEKKVNAVLELRSSTEEVEKQTIILHQTAVKLRNNLEKAKVDLDSVRKSVNKKQTEIDESNKRGAELNAQKLELEQEDMKLKELENKTRDSDILIHQVKRKSQQVSRLKQLVEALQDEVSFREAEVTKLEADAEEHKRVIKETNTKRSFLERRRIAADEKKRSILSALADREEKRKRVMEQRELIRKKREMVERDTDELDQLEATLTREEEKLADRIREMDEAARFAAEESERIANKELRRAAIEKDHRENVNRMMEHVEEYLTKFEDDAAIIERRFERLEKAAAQRRNTVELEQSKWMALMREKIEQADAMATELEAQISAGDNEVTLKGKIERLTAEHNDISERIEKERAEIVELSGGPGSEREKLERLERETREERERIAKEELILSTRALEQQKEEETLMAHHDDLQIKRDNLASQENMLRMRQVGSGRMLTLYKNQLSAAENRYNSLKKQLEDLKAAFE